MLTAVKGWKTIIWSGLLVVGGIVVAVLQAVNIDILSVVLPEKYRPFAPLIISAIGAITGYLRTITDTPFGVTCTPPLPPLPDIPPPGPKAGG